MAKPFGAGGKKATNSWSLACSTLPSALTSPPPLSPQAASGRASNAAASRPWMILIRLPLDASRARLSAGMIARTASRVERRHPQLSSPDLFRRHTLLERALVDRGAHQRGEEALMGGFQLVDAEPD